MSPILGLSQTADSRERERESSISAFLYSSTWLWMSVSRSCISRLDWIGLNCMAVALNISFSFNWIFNATVADDGLTRSAGAKTEETMPLIVNYSVCLNWEIDLSCHSNIAIHWDSSICWHRRARPIRTAAMQSRRYEIEFDNVNDYMLIEMQIISKLESQTCEFTVINVNTFCEMVRSASACDVHSVFWWKKYNICITSISSRHAGVWWQISRKILEVKWIQVIWIISIWEILQQRKFNEKLFTCIYRVRRTD